MGKKKIRLLYYGDFDGNTGYSMVSKNLIKYWHRELKDAEITIFATNNFRENDYSFYDNTYVIPAPKTRSKEDTDAFCRNSFLKMLYNGNYTHLFCNHDVEVLNQILPYLKQIKQDKHKEGRPSFKSLFYFPIDSPVRKKDLEVLSFFNKNVTYTKYGESLIKDLVPSSVATKVTSVPHGTNTKDFFPIESTKEIEAKRKYYFGKNKDKFIFGTVNRNSARKDIATLMITFANFVKQYPNSYLYIHSNPDDQYGVNLKRLAERLGLIEKEHIQFADNNISEGQKEEKGCNSYPLDMLNDLYNCMDCFVTTTTAEGWGLTVTEAMATKTKVICPIHTSLTEITNDGEIVIPLRRLHQSVFVNDYDKIRYKTDTGELFDAMKIALSPDKKNLATLSYEKVVKLNWKKISHNLLTLLKGL